MEVEHLVGIGIALIISLVLMWIVWSYFCQDKSDDDEEQSESGESESFSSTYVITTTHKKNPRRTRETSFSSCNDATTEEESEGGDNKARHKRPRRKSKKSRTASYLFQKNNYGLADPFAEWAPSQSEDHRDRSKSPQVVYPKSPVLKHHEFKKNHSVVNM